MNWKETANQIRDYLIDFSQSSGPDRIFVIFRLIAIIFSIFLILSILILIWRSIAFLTESSRMTFHGVDISKLPKNKITKKWVLIENRLKSRDESNYKMAVIEADKLLDNLLERAGYHGQSMAERLKKITPAQLSNLDAIWKAHKLRNRIVHDIDRKIKYDDACGAIESFKKALEELEAI